MLGKQLVLAAREALEDRHVRLIPRVAEGDERVSLQPARIVSRHVKTFEALDHLSPVFLEPLHEIDMPGCALVKRAAALLGAPVPRTNVLADVTPVDLGAEI
jgi:hypothetical protein